MGRLICGNKGNIMSGFILGKVWVRLDYWIIFCKKGFMIFCFCWFIIVKIVFIKWLICFGFVVWLILIFMVCWNN